MRADGWRPEPSVENDAGERTPAVCAPSGQQRIVAKQGAGAYPDRVHLRAVAMHLAIGRGSREPGPRAGVSRNLAVETRRDLDRDKRPSVAHDGEKRAVQPDGFGCENTRRHLNAALAQHRQATA